MRRIRWRWVWLGAYVALLMASHLVRRNAPDHFPRPDQHTLSLPVVGDMEEEGVPFSYAEVGATDGPVVVLLHGSPVASSSMMDLAHALPDSLRLLIPDLPGFGGSGHSVPDYSVAAHAQYVVAWLETLDIGQVHLVGYSMGSGVALEVYNQAPNRVASVVMLAGIGVQELELLGNYHLNHAIHGAQLTALWLLHEATPHFGWLDDAILSVPYARNFYDTDQRPLRDILNRFEPPMLILHSRDDELVPYAAAEEHARIVPQSELVTLEEHGHGVVFLEPSVLVDPLATFVARVENGAALHRADASPERVEAAAVPPSIEGRRVTGMAVVVLMLLLALATFASEDLACIGAGLLVANGTLGFVAATAGAFLGIFVGDIGLFFIGRWVGKPALRRKPLSWIISEEKVEDASVWLKQRGPVVVLLSRVIPGTRLPTYVGAGALGMKLRVFAGYFLIAALLWTPFLVGISMFLGEAAFDLFETFERYALWALLGLILALWLLLKLVVPLFSHAGRRRLIGRWKRLRHWEFWPPWLFYPPVLIYLAYLMLRHRSLTLFTAVNPGIEYGGFVGESKAAILQSLNGAGDFLAQFAIIPPKETEAERVEAVHQFMSQHQLDYPVVLKPDIGERGAGVVVARSVEDVRTYFEHETGVVIVQAYAPGHEFGVFYIRHPDEDKGHIFSVTEKRMPVLTGDGVHTLERLILDDPRAVCMADWYLHVQAGRRYEVLPEGETVQLVELGTHARGAIFLDGGHLVTPALTDAIDRISQTVDGFFFGRYDIRTPSVDDFQQGQNFKIVELNGVASEATHIYDPKNSVWEAYRVLRSQWRYAFEIAAANVQQGATPTPIGVLLRRILEKWNR